jgi:hypothetical protein
MERTCRITTRCTGKKTRASPVRSAPAVVPQIDHRISKGLECVVQLTETVKALQAPKLTFSYGAVADSGRDFHPANGTPSRAYTKPLAR